MRDESFACQLLQGGNMRTLPYKSLFLSCVAACATVMAGPLCAAAPLPTSTKEAAPGSREATATTASRSIASPRVKCAGCGVIESVRKIEFDERVAGRCA